jgi:hypothetical protein
MGEMDGEKQQQEVPGRTNHLLYFDTTRLAIVQVTVVTLVIYILSRVYN